MHRRGVVDRAPDPRVLQGRAYPVALGRATDEQVVDMARLVLGQIEGGVETELGVASGGLAAKSDPRVELGEEDAQDGGLELVEPRVVAEQLEVDLVPR